MKSRWTPQKSAILLFTCAVALAVILRFLALFQFSPDSATYLTGAINLLKHGDLFLYVNWPSKDMHPMPEPYAEFAPGFPFYILPFLVIFKNPLLASAVAQTVAILYLFAINYILLNELYISLLLRITATALVGTFSFYQYILGYFWTEPLFISLTFTTAFFSLRLLSERKPHRFNYLLAGSLFFGSTIKYIGILNVGLLLFPALKKKEYKALTLYSFVAAVPIVGWMARNRLRFGYSTSTHHFGHQIISGYLTVPFKHIVSTFSQGSYLLFLPYLGILLFPLMMPLRNNKLEAERFNTLLIGFLAMFLGIWMVSILAVFNVLDNRLLSPSYAIFIVLILYSFELIVSFLPVRYFASVTALLLFGSLLHPMSNPRALMEGWPPRLGNLPESTVWNELIEKKTYTTASHFYSDYDFNHQIFAQKPQRIIWWDSVSESDAKTYLSLGTDPFFIFNVDSDLGKQFKQFYGNLGLRRTELSHFVIYSKY